MDNKELIEQINVMEKNSNTRMQIAANKHDKEIKYEEGYKQALWDVEKLLTK